jgi:uncharacterized protein with ATP-grasp and redox domains
MKLTTECIPCTIKAALMTIRELTDQESDMRGLFAQFMQIPAMRGLDWEMTGSDLIAEIFRIITGASGNPDPFLQRKRLQNERCLELYPWLKGLVTRSENPLFTAVNLAIIGNSIDPMGHQSSQDLAQVIQENLENPVSREGFIDLSERLARSRSLLYLGDNCGEIVIDKLLIETIKDQYDIEVAFVVRSAPILNDATFGDANLVGISDAATVMENGIDGPSPGTVLSRCSEELRRLWSSADLIISKGGGNFDCLHDEDGITVPLYYMLMCKCNLYADYFNVPVHHPILYGADWQTSYERKERDIASDREV